MSLQVDAIPEGIRPRIWYRQRAAYAFLVDAPLTFGHTQLVCTNLCTIEDESFAAASPHIVHCMRKLQQSLPSPCEGWDSLACYTETSGDYI